METLKKEGTMPNKKGESNRKEENLGQSTFTRPQKKTGKGPDGSTLLGKSS